MNVPQLRFKEFSGEWETSSLESLIKSIDSGWSPFCDVDAADDDEWGVLKTTSTTWDGFSDKENKRLPNGLEPRLNLEVKTNDVLITRAGPIERVGVVAHVNHTRSKLMISDKLIRVRFKEKQNSIFFAISLGSAEIQDYLLKRKTGLAAAQTNISQATLLEAQIKYPSFSEQTKIANFLTAIDERINQLTRKKELMTQYKQGVMQQIFSQQLRFKDDNGEDFADWEEKKLGDIATFLKGKGISKADIDINGQTPCIRYGELYTEYKEAITIIKSKTNIDLDDLVLSKKNDVIIPASGETQIDIATASCVLLDDIALGGDLNIIRSKENGIFLSYYLNTQKKLDIAKLAQGNSVVHLYSSQLKTLELHLPSLIEQTKIANFLTTLDEKIQQISQQIEATKQYKQGLLQQMFV